MNKTSLQIILNHFGRMTQIFKLMEELAELLGELAIALAKYGLDADKILADPKVQTEMADVILLLKQFGMIPDLAIALGKEVDEKGARTLERMESGYYE